METEPSPYDCGGNSLADSARNLARTLQSAPAGESERAAALRRQLVWIARELAERWSAEAMTIEGGRAFDYHRTLWTVREFAVGLGSAPDSSPAGVRVVLEAFAERFLPNTLVMLRPAGLATLTVREQMETLRERLRNLDMDAIPEEPAAPDRVILARCPAGEVDNSLMACSALASFHAPRTSYPFAASNGGPAYFFALAADIQNNKGFNDAFDPPRLCFIGELLEIGGWLEHPQIGPLIARWRVHFGFGPDYLDRKILNKATLQKMREAQGEYRAAPPQYTPADFDREAPAMWERLRQALPPAELAMQSGAAGPRADVIGILNAAWSFAQLHLDDLYKTLHCTTASERYEARVTLNRLVAQAIAPASADRIEN